MAASTQRSAAEQIITVTGWAEDPDTTSPIQVRVGMDGQAVETVTANLSRPDVNRIYHNGTQHGFTARVTASDAEHSMCLRALNVLAGRTSPIIGCKIVIARHPVPPSAPHVTATPQYGAATVSWTPGADGGAPPDSYSVHWAGHTKVVNASIHTVGIIALAPGTAYTFSVTAHNLAGTGPAGAATVTIPRQPPPQTTPAPVSTSHYPRNLTGTSTDATQLRGWGASDAAHNPGGHSYVILLDIVGQSTRNGQDGVVLSATSRFITYAALVTAVNAYVDGYASQQPLTAPVTIAVGTNNDMTVNATTGAQWAREVINPIGTHAAKYSGISIAGANDVEPGFSADAAHSRAWLSGFLGATSRRFVFNGSADGCNWSAINGGCNNGWTAADLYWLSGGASPSRILGLPQIYNATMPKQWKYMSLTGVAGSQPKINFGGPLTEWTACSQAGSCSSLTGHNAWTALWDVIRSDARSSQGSLPWSTDLRIN